MGTLFLGLRYETEVPGHTGPGIDMSVKVDYSQRERERYQVGVPGRKEGNYHNSRKGGIPEPYPIRKTDPGVR